MKQVIHVPNGLTIDTEKNRNAKMIEALLRPNVNGVFLFYLEGSDINIVTPPGLTPDEMQQFKMEFMVFFESWAKKANRRIK